MTPLEQTLTRVRDLLAGGDAVGAASQLAGVEKLLGGWPTARERELFAVCSELLRRTMDGWRTKANRSSAARSAAGAYGAAR